MKILRVFKPGRKERNRGKSTEITVQILIGSKYDLAWWGTILTPGILGVVGFHNNI